jgi:DNA invertase Pin-like site-specific DNA recombinase
MLDHLAAGDLVTVTRSDRRLGRSTFDLFGIIKQIVDAKAQFRSLAEPWADTGTARLMIAVLGSLADVERGLYPQPACKRRSENPSLEAAGQSGGSGVKIRQQAALVGKRQGLGDEA